MRIEICFFGSYDRNYSKNVVLLKGFKNQGVKVVHCYHPNYFSLFHYLSLIQQFLKKARNCDVIFVAFFGHYDVWFAWILAKIFRKKLVFDPLISIYNTRVEDRKYFKKNSFRAKFYILFDFMNAFLADHVFIDTYAQLNYYQKKFHVKGKKFFVIRVGADETVLKPEPNFIKSPIQLLFYGSYQPSQGAQKIIEAANLLKKENFEWIFIGQGQDRPKVEKYAKRNKLKNVAFIDTIPFDELVRYMNDANIIFGVFGNTSKTKIVIHNKVFQAIAMGRVLITQETPAVKEILKNGENVILTKPNAKSIAREILKLKDDKGKIKKISLKARNTFMRNFTTEKVAESAQKAFEKVLSTSSKNR